MTCDHPSSCECDWHVQFRSELSKQLDRISGHYLALQGVTKEELDEWAKLSSVRLLPSPHTDPVDSPEDNKDEQPVPTGGLL